MIYLVTGTCGEYEDLRIWNVKAFSTQDNADRFCEILDDWCRERKIHKDNYGQDMADPHDRPTSCPYDGKFQTNYTGTNYEVEEVWMEET